MNKPANRCDYTYTHTIYFYQREELAEIVNVCLLYSKIAYDFAYSFICQIMDINKHTYYKYKKIGVV